MLDVGAVQAPSPSPHPRPILLLASSNPAKLARLRWMVAGWDLDLQAPADLGPEAPHQEGDESLEANARAKARSWSRAYGVAALATDGGLVVPALGSAWNPVRTRRAAGARATDVERARHLLALAGHLRGDQRQAVRREVAALARPDGTLVGTWSASSQPRRLAERYDPRGLPDGFWIPGVLLYGDGRRYGDLTPAEREEADDHWLALRDRVRDGLAQLMAAARAADPPAPAPGRAEVGPLSE